MKNDNQNERNLGLKHHICGICNAEGEFQSYLAPEMMQGTGDEFEYFVCPECGCLQIDGMPDNLGKYYADGYYSMNDLDIPDAFPPISHDSKKVLDIGCGIGHWLVELAKKGWANLYGCDPFIDNDIKYSDRVHIKKASIHELSESGFDFIRMGDSFEHMSDPLEVLDDAKSKLKDDGIIDIYIPTFPNIAFDMFGPHWFQLDAPRHIYLHSRRSIEYLAERAGLKVVKYEYDSNGNQIWISYFYQKNIPYNKITKELINEHFSPEEISEIEKLSKEANEKGYGDHMKVTLIKE